MLFGCSFDRCRLQGGYEKLKFKIVESIKAYTQQLPPCHKTLYLLQTNSVFIDRFSDDYTMQ
jgi:hypothetical protein